MISRKTARVLADVYVALFEEPDGGSSGSPSGRQRQEPLKLREFGDFLYERNWQPWVLGEVRALDGTDQLRDWIMDLHTGQSLASFPDPLPPAQRPEVGQMLLKQLARDALAWPDGPDSHLSESAQERLARMRGLLELDGYTWRDGDLYYSEADDLEIEGEPGILDALMRELGLHKREILERHLERSEGYYLEGEWAESLGHSRKFLEAVLREVATQHHMATTGRPLDPPVYSRPKEVLGYLQDQGMIEPDENETLSCISDLLSAKDTNPFTSGRDRARFSRYLALTFAHLALLRLQGALYAITEATTGHP